MVQLLRQAGIAVGSLVAAWLAVSLVLSVLIAQAPGGALGWLCTLVLGGLVYRDIMRREQRSA